jgi:glutamyl-tRNA reductase
MLTLVGLSHHAAPVEIRERAFVPLEEAGRVAWRLAGSGGEAICLSTCNRTELYVVGDDGERRAWETLRALSGLDPEELRPVVYRLHEDAAALHLFRVAAGLDSLVPGEGEILGQVRQAYEAGASGPILDRLFRQALHAGKKVRTHTAIGESPASVSSAGAALAEQVFGDLAGCRVIVIGAGHVSELAARALAGRGATVGYVANRSGDRAEALATRFGAEPLPLEAVPAHLHEVDVVVSSTTSPGHTLTRTAVEAALAARRRRPLFLIDLAVPRDLDPAIHQLDGCYLYDIDALQAVVAQSLAGRRREAARAEGIVREEAERFREWHAAREVAPAIASLRAWAEEIRSSELEKARLGVLTEAQRAALESVTSQIVNKLLHLPTVRLKEAAAGADGASTIEAVRHLFGLADDK